MFRFFSLAALVATASSTRADSQGWPAWRGPHGDGTTEATGLPLTWSETENVAWKVELPAWSSSTPIVWEDRVFVVSPEAGGIAPPDDPELAASAAGPSAAGLDLGGSSIFLHCLDRTDGRELWRSRIGGGNTNVANRHNMASPSPVTDGESVWVMTGTGEIVALDLGGKELWRRSLAADFGVLDLTWAYAASPLLHRDRLIVAMIQGSVRGRPGYVLAVDKKSGGTIWKTDRPSDAVGESRDGHCTPALVEHEGRFEFVINAADYVTGHDAESGEELWRVGGLNPRRNRYARFAPSSIWVAGRIFAPGSGNPLLAIRPGGRGEVSESHVDWKSRWGPEFTSPLANDRYVWTIGSIGRVACLDVESGEQLYTPKRVATGTYVASPVLAEGRIYVTSVEGTTTVIAAGPRFKILATNELEADYVLASPAVVQGQIFLRSAKWLYCLASGAGLDSPPKP